MRADFHCHSTASDGTLAPAGVVERAYAQGVEVLALTDHDTTAGVAEASARASELEMRLVPAAEFSAVWRERTLHIVGLGLDPQAQSLCRLTERLGALRRVRAEAIGARFAKLGIEGMHAAAQELAGAAEPTRTHFARALIDAGRVANMNDAFKRYLRQGKPAYVAAAWPSLEEITAAIRLAGGIAVLAHPHAHRWTGAWLRRIVDAFVDAGGQALEVACGSSTPQNIGNVSAHVRRCGLYASQGSDFHTPESPWVELGRMPALPADLVPVWEADAVSAYVS